MAPRAGRRTRRQGRPVGGGPSGVSGEGRPARDPGAASIITQKIIAYDKAHLDSQTQRYGAEAKLREITRILKDPAAAEAVFTVIDDPMIRKLKGEASDLLAERSKLREQYRAKHPDLIQIEAQIKHVNERIREEVGKLRQGVENEYQVAKAREASMAASLNELRREAQQLVTKEARALSLQREKDSNDELVAAVDETDQGDGAHDGPRVEQHPRRRAGGAADPPDPAPDAHRARSERRTRRWSRNRACLRGRISRQPGPVA